MLRRLRAERRDGGFSLIELIIAVAIVALLAAIAIPIFRNQQMKAHESALRQEIKNVQTTITGIKAGMATPTTPFVGATLSSAINTAYPNRTKGVGLTVVYNCGYSGSGTGLQSAPGEYIIYGTNRIGAGTWTALPGAAYWIYVSQNDRWYTWAEAPFGSMLSSHTGAGSAGQECGNSGYSGGIYLTPQ